MRSQILICFFLSILSVSLTYAQCISGDCYNGNGTYVYPSGAKYVGEFQRGEIHGFGVCYYTDGSIYSGQWAHRFPHGKGTKIYPDGSKHSGNWFKGQLQNTPSSSRYANEDPPVDDNILAADVQTGCIQGDCSNGKGTFAYADGSKYEGSFLNNQPDGWGTWDFPNGDQYVGLFKKGYLHGKGTMYYAGGFKRTGDWQHGEFVRSEYTEVGCVAGNCDDGDGTYVFKDGEARYIGEFFNKKPHGLGVCYYASGDRYEGEWANGKFNGIGTLYSQKGAVLEGNWKAGRFLGKDEYASALPRPQPNSASSTSSSPQKEERFKDLRKRSPKVWAVVIGVSAYTHMPTLRFTDDDAYRIYAFLKSPQGGALPDEQIRILIDEDATKKKIIESMMDVFGKAGPNDLVFLYFSGHGLKGAFLPIDFDGFNNKLFHEEINAVLKNSPARFKLCIADACHSGSLLAMKDGSLTRTLQDYYMALAQVEPGSALIMSSKSDETSLESRGLRQGVFTHFLIRGIKGEADVNADTAITLQELYNYIFQNVRNYTHYRQSPIIKGKYDKNMVISFVK